jgi:hypothetical protein
VSAAIARLPPRGTVVASTSTKPMISTPAGALPTAPVDLLNWAASLPTRLSTAERTAAAKLVRLHELVLPGWQYDALGDLDEFRHGGVLAEFGWELLPP